MANSKCGYCGARNSTVGTVALPLGYNGATVAVLACNACTLHAHTLAARGCVGGVAACTLAARGSGNARASGYSAGKRSRKGPMAYLPKGKLPNGR